jgi:hypothetical protein
MTRADFGYTAKGDYEEDFEGHVDENLVSPRRETVNWPKYVIISSMAAISFLTGYGIGFMDGLKTVFENPDRNPSLIREESNISYTQPEIPRLYNKTITRKLKEK